MAEPWGPVTERWLADAAAATAQAVNSAACLLEVEGVIVADSFSRELLTTLLREIDAALGQHEWDGVVRPPAWPGTVGPDARAICGALLPMYANFAPDRDHFLKLGN